MGNPVGIPTGPPPPTYPDDYADLQPIDGDNIITTDESFVSVTGISDAVGASIVTFLVPYADSDGQGSTEGAALTQSAVVSVTDIGTKDYNNNELGTYTSTLPTAGVAPGIYVAESFIVFPNENIVGGAPVLEDGKPSSKVIVSIETPAAAAAATQVTPLTFAGTGAEITTDGRYLVYTDLNGDVHEVDLPTDIDTDLTATGGSITGTFAVDHAPTYGENASGPVTEYPTFASANGGYTFSSIHDFDDNIEDVNGQFQGVGYNPLPVVTDGATGVQSVVAGIGVYRYDPAYATAISDDGTVLLSVDTQQVIYGATGAGQEVQNEPAIYVSYLSPAGPGSAADVFFGVFGSADGFLWSNAAGWSAGVPANGANATLASAGVDDIANLSLARLDTGAAGLDIAAGDTLNVTNLKVGNGGLQLESGNLNIGVLTLANDAGFFANNPNAEGAQQAVTITIGGIAGTGDHIDASGPSGRIIVTGPEQGQDYGVYDGGMLVLDSLPTIGESSFEYDDGGGTLALLDPGPTITGIEDLAAGDVLELPGASLINVDLSTGSVTTSSGIYVVSGIESTVNSYTASHDASTGLEAITFTTYSGPDVFSGTVSDASGHHLWSNPGNWSEGTPNTGGMVSLTANGEDDIASLTLATLVTGGQVTTADGSKLIVNTLVTDNASALVADSDISGGSSTVAIYVDTISGSGGLLVADGANAILELTYGGEPDEIYQAEDGGRILLQTLSSGDKFGYVGTATLALGSPGTSTSGLLDAVGPGDVLELPGGSVENIVFGPHSLFIQTSYRNTDYTFTNVNFTGGVDNYVTGVDSATGLEAITFVAAPADVFSGTVSDAAGQYVWSDPANWSNNIPTNNDAVSLSSSGQDDIASLALTTLDTGGEVIGVDGSLLSVGTLLAESGTGLLADSEISGGSSTVSVILGTIIGSGGLFVSDGTGSSIEVLAGGEPDAIYQAEDGGLIVLDSLSSGSKLGFTGDSTLALALPASGTSAELDNLSIGDVLELPGTAVSAVSFGAHSLDITTSSGIYDFTNVTFSSGVARYSAAIDTGTGLEAITFSGIPQDVFQTSDILDGGTAPLPFTDDYVWQDPANWVNGAYPQNGDAVTVNTQEGIDDFDNLTLSSLTLDSGALLPVVGDLTVDTLTDGGLLIAQGGFGSPTELGEPPTRGVTVTVNNDADSSGGIFGADGEAAVFILNGPANAADFLFAEGGGMLELNAAPTSQLSFDDPLFGYFNGAGTIALKHPGTAAAELRYVRPGDVLELPGTAVSSVHIGTASLTIATSSGDYTFDVGEYVQPVTGYTAAVDKATGLEAITFTGPANPGVDVFSSNFEQADPNFGPGELWSFDGNWSNLVPRNGAAVEVQYVTGKISIDNIENLSLSSLSLDPTAQLIVGDALTAGSLDIAAGGLIYTEGAFTVTGAAENDGAFHANGVVDLKDGLAGSGAIQLQGADVLLHGGVAAAQTIEFGENTYGGSVGGSVLALFNPGSVISATIDALSTSDGLELPGTKVENVVFGASSITITTDAGSFDFANVASGIAGLDVDGYSASHDSTTGLEAISFTGRNLFYDNATANLDSPYYGDFLWSDHSNWSQGVPTSGASVDSDAAGFDDIANLSIGTLDLSASTLTVVQALNVNALYVAAGATLDDLALMNIVAQTVDDGTISTDPSSMTFTGAVTGTGTIEIGAGSSVTFDGAVAAGQTIVFLSDTGTLTIADPSAFDAKVEGAGTRIVGGTTVTALPVIAAPLSATISLGQTGTIGGISLSDTGSFAGERFTIVLNDSSGTLSATGAGISGAGSHALTLTGSLALVNAELATLSDLETVSGAGTISITAADSLGDTGAVATIAVTAVSNHVSNDFDGSGSSDVLFQNNNSGELLDWLTSGGTFSASELIAEASAGWKQVGSGDFNGDGTADILFQNTISGAVLDWAMSNGTYGSDHVLGVANPDWKLVGTGDFTGNGTSDILFQNINSGAMLDWAISNGTYVSAAVIGEANPDWKYLGTGDFTGDGTSDILFQNSISGELLAWRIDGGTFSGNLAIGTAPADMKFLGTGDFNGDGTSDILFENTLTSGLTDLQVLGGTLDKEIFLGSLASNVNFVGIGDYAGHGISNILLQDKSTGKIGYTQISGGSLASETLLGIANSDWKALAA